MLFAYYRFYICKTGCNKCQGNNHEFLMGKMKRREKSEVNEEVDNIKIYKSL